VWRHLFRRPNDTSPAAGVIVMDLVTLVTACAFTVDPKIMHALIWHRSGGEPWSFTVPGERQPQVYRTVVDAVRAAHATYPDDVAIRVGLTGLSGDPLPSHCSRRVRTSRSRRGRSHNSPNAARPLRASRTIRSTARSRSIAARGSGPTTPLRTQFGHRLRTTMHRTSRYGPTQVSAPLASSPHRSLRSMTPPCRRPAHWMIASAAGRALSFRQSLGRPTVRRSTIQQQTDLQPMRKSLTLRAHV